MSIIYGFKIHEIHNPSGPSGYTIAIYYTYFDLFKAIACPIDWEGKMTIFILSAATSIIRNSILYLVAY